MINISSIQLRRIVHLCASILLIASFSVSAQSSTANTTLESLDFAVLPGERVELVLGLSGLIQEPKSFTTDNPARIAFDLADTANKLNKRNHPINSGMVRSVNTIEAMGRTRVILNLVTQVPYKYRLSGNEVIITVDGSDIASTQAKGIKSSIAAFSNLSSDISSIEDIDFRRGSDGQGMVQISLSNPATVADVREEGKDLVVDFINTSLPEELERRLDVLDFATPVSIIDTFRNGNNVRMTISTSEQYNQFAYQADNLFTIEFRPIAKEQETAKRKEFQYTGERLSLNFQDIEVRAVLQLIADFTGFNLVASDTVSGKITLRLQNVPWDQAMDIILRTKGLAKRESGNVVLVAPSEEIAAREKLELESQKQIVELAPLTSEYIQINYAKASDIATLLKSKDNTLMSARGNVTIDERTNTLLIQDTADKITEVLRLVNKLDVPVRQVLIESRVVIANNDFTKELGVQFGVTGAQTSGNTGLLSTTGNAFGTDTMVGSAITNIASTGQQLPITAPALANRMNFSVPASAGTAGSIAFAVLQDDYILDLELSAVQAEGRGEIVSSPRVITSDQNTARIEQGVEVPYQEASSSGATTVAFKKAVLSLEVTPQITPDDRIIMDLEVSKDNPDFSRSVLGVPPLDTRSIETKVLVDNGETVVLGGVYEQTTSNAVTKVPFFGDLPLVGALFRNKVDVDNKNELLIFVTPRILKESLSTQ